MARYASPGDTTRKDAGPAPDKTTNVSAAVPLSARERVKRWTKHVRETGRPSEHLAEALRDLRRETDHR